MSIGDEELAGSSDCETCHLQDLEAPACPAVWYLVMHVNMLPRVLI